VSSGILKWQPDQYVTHIHLRQLGEMSGQELALLAGLLGSGGPRLLALTGVVSQPVAGGIGLRVARLAWVGADGRVFDAGWDRPVPFKLTGPRRLQIRDAAPSDWCSRDVTDEELQNLGLSDEVRQRCVRICRADPQKLLELIDVDAPPGPNVLPLGTLDSRDPAFSPTFRAGGCDLFPPFATVAAIPDVGKQLALLADLPAVRRRPDLLADITLLRRRAAPFAGPPLTPAELAAGLEAVCVRAGGDDLAKVVGLPAADVDRLVFDRGYLLTDLFARVGGALGAPAGPRWRRVAATPIKPPTGSKAIARAGERRVATLSFSFQSDPQLASDPKLPKPSGPHRLVVAFSEIPVAQVGYNPGSYVTATMVQTFGRLGSPAELGLDLASAGLPPDQKFRTMELDPVTFAADAPHELHLYFVDQATPPSACAVFAEQA
jgi:hypothetical protein